MISDSMAADVRGAGRQDISSILVRRYHLDAQHVCDTLSYVTDIVRNGHC